MIHERADGGPEMVLAEWHDPAYALRLDGPDKSLGKRVQIGTSGRQLQRLHTAVPQQVPEGGGVERVSLQGMTFHGETASLVVGQAQSSRTVHGAEYAI